MYPYLVSLFFILSAANVAEKVFPNDRLHLEDRMMQSFRIHQALEEVNQAFFASHFMHLELLKNCPQVIPTLVEWLYDEWHPYDTSLTKEKLFHSFDERLNDDRIPLTFVVLKGQTPIGMVSLKEQKSPEFADLSEGTPWLGGLQVVPEERNQGIGQTLLKFAAIIAQRLGHKKIYFYTSNPANVEWYLKRRALMIETRPFRGHTITLMQMVLE